MKTNEYDILEYLKDPYSLDALLTTSPLHFFASARAAFDFGAWTPRRQKAFELRPCDCCGLCTVFMRGKTTYLGLLWGTVKKRQPPDPDGSDFQVWRRILVPCSVCRPHAKSCRRWTRVNANSWKWLPSWRGVAKNWTMETEALWQSTSIGTSVGYRTGSTSAKMRWVGTYLTA